jgi:hypothetical protein
MNTHLKTTLTLLSIVAIATGVYFDPITTLVVVVLLFSYIAIYTDIKETENEKKKNGEYNRTTEGDI